MKSVVPEFLRLPGSVFSSRKELRSDSDNGRYLSAVKRAVYSQRSFDRFKRLRGYAEILEHVSKSQGSAYLRTLEERRDGVLDNALSTLLESDSLGSPRKFYYPSVDKALSPTTLRYLKVVSDLKILFGDKFSRVAEIGGGYGGQALVNDQMLTIQSATIFDLPLVNQLSGKYLNSFLMRGSFAATTINEFQGGIFDLVISNYAFSELPRDLQLKYVEKVLSNAAAGYLTMNTGLSEKSSGEKLSLIELENYLPKFEVLRENPLTAPGNYLICWGTTQPAVSLGFQGR